MAAIRIRCDAEGYPLCPKCSLRLVEESPGYWVCPFDAVFERALRDVLIGGDESG